MAERRIVLYPHQSLAFKHEGRLTAMWGGVGSGKTFTMLLKLVKHLNKFPGANAMITRAVAADIHNSIWTDFVRDFGTHIGKMNRQDNLIILNNGSRIFFKHGWDDVRGVKHLDGYNTSCFLMNQAEDQKEATYRKLKDRNRRVQYDGGKIPDSEFLELLDGNPQGRDWVFDLAARGVEEVEHRENIKGELVPYWSYTKDDSLLVRVRTQNYSFVPDGYREGLLGNKNKRYVFRYVDGGFDNFTGLVYEMFDEDVHLIDPFPVMVKLNHKRFARILALDWGLNNPTAAVWMLYDRYTDAYFLYREYKERGIPAEQQAKILVGMCGDEQYDLIVLDPSAWHRDPLYPDQSVGLTFQSIFDEAGLDLQPGNNNEKKGIDLVSDYMTVREGSTRLYVMKDLEMWREECVKYKFKDSDMMDRDPKRNPREEPIDKDNHLMDCTYMGVLGHSLYEEQ